MTPDRDALIRAHDPYAALRYVDYRLTLSGAVLASIGLEVQAVAVGWELYLRTESTWILGLSGLAQFLPVLLLALPAGQAADHFNRKILFQLAQAIMAAASIGLAILSSIDGPVSLMLGCLVISGIGRALSAPARTSLYPQLVPLECLPNAVAWNSTGWQLASVSGPCWGGLLLTPAVGGFLVANAPAGLLLANTPTVLAYEVAGASAFLCILLLLPVNPIRSTLRPGARSLKELLAGVRFVWTTKLLLAAITLDLFAVLLGGATALLPVFAHDILEVGPKGLGWLRAAPAVGALTVAVLLAHRAPLERPGLTLLLAVAGFGLATIGFGLSQKFYLSFFLLFVTGALDNISVVVRGTLMQVLTPDSMRGRVAAVNSVFISSSNELGAFESGTTAYLFGPIASVVAGGIGTLAVVALVWWQWPALAALVALHRLKVVQQDEEAV